jgi:hypothetical protein
VGQAAAAAATAAAPATVPAPSIPAKEPLRVECSDARTEQEKVALLYRALTEAKKNAGESVSGSMDSFTSFVQKKTDQIRKQYGCATVEYSVELESGQVRLKAKAKV